MPKSKVLLPSTRIKDLSRQKFGRLTVIEFSHVDSRGDAYWKCTCSCGGTSVTQGSAMRFGRVKSCGCWWKEKRLKHGHSKRGAMSPEYCCWRSLKSRCLNKNQPVYILYGGRGITVCKRWLNSFKAFLEDMGRKPSPDHSIDRIDNNGPYQKSNCRWALRITQARNKRNNRKLEFRGENLCISEWAERLGIQYQRIAARLQRGWSIEKPLLAHRLDQGESSDTVRTWSSAERK